MQLIGTFDLRSEPSATRQTRLYYLAEDLQPGQYFEIQTDDDPGIIMESVALQLRHKIIWEILSAAPGDWRIKVQHRDDAESLSLTDFLRQAQERLDRTLAKAMHACNEGRVELAPPFVREYDQGFRRFMHLESRFLPQQIPLPDDPRIRDAVSGILAEYPRLLEDFLAVEAAFEEDSLPEAWEVAPFFSLLSGALAKHEARKEKFLYPVWESMLNRPENAALKAQLVERCKEILAGAEDARQ
ncbi:DUF2249 domain-containing protein [Thermithiobacillus tepidarius DSM 3134]|uniref:DUF2249 domain-containing protein n=1 Tax=Thermithiobacillus tepidarius TaxID=929 RepID=UPI0004109B70|nr:DUF2249 domain-containing protein [Thermithiobacillus tepidarius]